MKTISCLLFAAFLLNGCISPDPSDTKTSEVQTPAADKSVQDDGSYLKSEEGDLSEEYMQWLATYWEERTESGSEGTAFIAGLMKLFAAGETPQLEVLERQDVLVGPGIQLPPNSMQEKLQYTLFSWHSDKLPDGERLGNLAYNVPNSESQQQGNISAVHEYLYRHHAPGDRSGTSLFPAYNFAINNRGRNLMPIAHTKGKSLIMRGMNGLHFIRQNGNYLIVLQWAARPGEPQPQNITKENFLDYINMAAALIIDEKRSDLFVNFLPEHMYGEDAEITP